MGNLRINVPLERGELQALISMSNVDCRPPREQMRHLLREEARRRGLLDAESSTQGQGQNNTTEEAGHAER